VSKAAHSVVTNIAAYIFRPKKYLLHMHTFLFHLSLWHNTTSIEEKYHSILALYGGTYHLLDEFHYVPQPYTDENGNWEGAVCGLLAGY